MSNKNMPIISKRFCTMGFTLIELIIVMVIIGIAAGVGVPKYISSLETFKFRNTLNEVSSFLREERLRAISMSKTTSVAFNLQNGRCWNEEKKTIFLPLEIELSAYKTEMYSDIKKEKEIKFYPNGTATEERIGFSCNKMTSVLHVEPLGGLVYFRTDEDIGQFTRCPRNQEIQ
ncbi:MAG TPA: pilus assembly FimT family protein [Candidatus Brocadiaceae bacterium]